MDGSLENRRMENRRKRRRQRPERVHILYHGIPGFCVSSTCLKVGLQEGRYMYLSIMRQILLHQDLNLLLTAVGHIVSDHMGLETCSTSDRLGLPTQV